MYRGLYIYLFRGKRERRRRSYKSLKVRQSGRKQERYTISTIGNGSSIVDGWCTAWKHGSLSQNGSKYNLGEEVEERRKISTIPPNCRHRQMSEVDIGRATHIFWWWVRIPQLMAGELLLALSSSGGLTANRRHDFNQRQYVIFYLGLDRHLYSNEIVSPSLCLQMNPALITPRLHLDIQRRTIYSSD